MIPNEAVEAAMRAWKATPFGGDALMSALEAAAPHMQAPAWDEGNVSGQMGRWWEDNPYRSQT